MVYAFFEWLLSRGVNPMLNGVSEWGTRRDEDACAHPLCGSVWSHQCKKAHWIRTHRVFPASPINSILALRAKIYYIEGLSVEIINSETLLSYPSFGYKAFKFSTHEDLSTGKPGSRLPHRFDERLE